MSALETPFLIVVEVLLVLALWALYLVVAGGARGRVAPPGDRLRALAAPLWERERRLSGDLGWPLRWWVALRAGTALAGLAIGIWLGTPLTALGAFLIALLGLPYLVSGRADRRRLAREQALVEMARSVTSLVRDSRQTIDAALTEQGRHPHPALRTVVAPLARSQQSIRERLREVDRRAMSPIANRICVDLLIAHSITPEAFLAVAAQVLLPQYERDLEIQRRNHAAAAGARATVVVVVGLMCLLLVMVMRTSTLRHAYASALGQLMLLVIAGMVAFILFLIHQFTPRSVWVHWDLATIDETLERRYA